MKTTKIILYVTLNKIKKKQYHFLCFYHNPNVHPRPDLPFGFWFIGNNSPHSGVVRHRTSRSVAEDASGEEVLHRELVQALGRMV